MKIPGIGNIDYDRSLPIMSFREDDDLSHWMWKYWLRQHPKECQKDERKKHSDSVGENHSENNGKR